VEQTVTVQGVQCRNGERAVTGRVGNQHE